MVLNYKQLNEILPRGAKSQIAKEQRVSRDQVSKVARGKANNPELLSAIIDFAERVLTERQTKQKELQAKYQGLQSKIQSFANKDTE